MRFESGVQNVSWFRKEYQEGTITLRPPYQRKPVWATRQKCYLIESILFGYPIPEIFIHEVTTPSGATTHAVVDGQQRIRTVLQFLGLATVGPDGKPETDEDEFTGFALDKFDKRVAPSPWFGKRFIDLTDEERVRLYEYKFHVRSLYGVDESDLREMFTRLNRYLTPLSAQELRHATYVGPFAKLAERLAENEYWLTSGLVTRALIRRLGDVEFTSQLLIGVMHGPQGGSASIVDEYYRQYEDFDLEEGVPHERSLVRRFEQAQGLINKLYPRLGESGELRWGNRADYYSLFVALAEVLGEGPTAGAERIRALRDVLTAFSGEVNRRLAKEDARVTASVRAYAAAIEKGVNDKHRRAERHRILRGLIVTALEGQAARRPGSARSRN